MHSVDEKKVLVFKLAGQEHGVEVSQVREILAAQSLPEPHRHKTLKITNAPRRVS